MTTGSGDTPPTSIPAGSNPASEILPLDHGTLTGCVVQHSTVAVSYRRNSLSLVGFEHGSSTTRPPVPLSLPTVKVNFGICELACERGKSVTTEG